MGRVIRVITHDPALTTNVLRLAYSAVFGCGRRVETLDEAVGRLGFETLCRMVVAVCGPRIRGPSPRGYGLDPGQL
jgi:HD-like signal output (HDOD) protein